MIRWKAISISITEIAFGLVAASAVHAEMRSAPNFDRAGREAIFREMKAIESESHRERIQILIEAEACIQRARVFREYRECEWAEQRAREQLQDRLRPKREDLRDRIRSVWY
jgi:hypothetical protein